MLISSEGNYVIANEDRELVTLLYNAIQRDQAFRRQLKKVERSGDERFAALLRDFMNGNSRLIGELRRLLNERVENRSLGRYIRSSPAALGGTEHGSL